MVFTDKEDTNTNTRLNTDTDTSISVSYQYFGMLKYTEYRYDTNTDTATIYTDTNTADIQKVRNLGTLFLDIFLGKIQIFFRFIEYFAKVGFNIEKIRHR